MDAKVLVVNDAIHCGPWWKGGEFERENEEAMRRLHGREGGQRFGGCCEH